MSNIGEGETVPQRVADLFDAALAKTSELISPGDWLGETAALNAVERGEIASVLVDYLGAMLRDRSDPALAWTAGTTMWRVGLPELAVGLLLEAVRRAERWQGAEVWDVADMWDAVGEVSEAMDLIEVEILALSQREALGKPSSRQAEEVHDREFDFAVRLSSEILALTEVKVHQPTALQGATPKAKRTVRARGRIWVVQKPGADRASGRFATKADALHRAREIVANQGGGTVEVIGSDGSQVLQVAGRSF